VTAPVLVAGVGNVLFGDDGFGVEVARRLAAGPLPAGVEVKDFGIRGIHLAFELLDPRALVLLLDAMPRGGPAGSLYVLEPELDDEPEMPDAHAMQLPAVFAAVRAMGGTVPPVLIVGCEPASCDGPELSAPVRAAVDPALELVRSLIATRTPAVTTGERSEHEPEDAERGARGCGAARHLGDHGDAEHAPVHEDEAHVSRGASGGEI
jgi:hydrogenase maturation protease